VSTIYDVAKMAGVAPSTVSRALNGGPVAADKLAKVIAACQALEFVPDRAARRLKRKASEVLGLIISDIENPFFTSVARGVEDIARSAGLSVVLCNTDEDMEKEAEYISVVIAERMTGVIISPASTTKSNVGALIERGIAVVAIDRKLPGERVDLVRLANEDAPGRRQATCTSRGIGALPASPARGTSRPPPGDCAGTSLRGRARRTRPGAREVLLVPGRRRVRSHGRTTRATQATRRGTRGEQPDDGGGAGSLAGQGDRAAGNRTRRFRRRHLVTSDSTGAHRGTATVLSGRSDRRATPPTPLGRPQCADPLGQTPFRAGNPSQ
jgi:hypothetical protein